MGHYYWVSHQTCTRLQIGAGVCAVPTADAGATAFSLPILALLRNLSKNLITSQLLNVIHVRGQTVLPPHGVRVFEASATGEINCHIDIGHPHQDVKDSKMYFIGKY